MQLLARVFNKGLSIGQKEDTVVLSADIKTYAGLGTVMSGGLYAFAGLVVMVGAGVVGAVLPVLAGAALATAGVVATAFGAGLCKGSYARSGYAGAARWVSGKTKTLAHAVRRRFSQPAAVAPVAMPSNDTPAYKDYYFQCDRNALGGSSEDMGRHVASMIALEVLALSEDGIARQVKGGLRQSFNDASFILSCTPEFAARLANRREVLFVRDAAGVKGPRPPKICAAAPKTGA